MFLNLFFVEMCEVFQNRFPFLRKGTPTGRIFTNILRRTRVSAKLWRADNYGKLIRFEEN